MNLDGKVAIITGAGGGVGKALVRRFASAGAHVIAADVNAESITQICEESQADGHDVIAMRTDVASESDVIHMVKTTAEKYGRVDILINNAAIRIIRSILDHTVEDWHRTLDVNLTSAFLCSRAVIPYMIKEGSGKIINVSSIAGLTGRINRAAYCAAKFGLIGFTEAIATDLGGTGICVNALAPGLVRTPLNEAFAMNEDISAARASETLVKRWGEPSEIAAAAYFLASDEANYITGTVLRVDGGWLSYKDRAFEEKLDEEEIIAGGK